MRISVFTVMLPELTPEEAVAEAAASGYDGIEWRIALLPEDLRKEPPSFWGNNRCTLEPTLTDARRARELCDRAGLAISGLGTYVERDDLAGAQHAMLLAHEAGAPFFRVDVGGLDGQSYRARFAGAQRFLSAVEKQARRCGITAVIEIHNGTICPSASLAHSLVSTFDPAAIGVIYDPGNMVYEGFEDYQLGVELLGPYLAHVHVKNGAYARSRQHGGVWRPVPAPLDDGAVDFPRFFSALRAAGYVGWISIEDFSRDRPSREALRHNMTFVRKIIAEVSEPSENEPRG